MVGSSARSRVYLVYQHSLFAEGIRSLLLNQPAVKIVGAERERRRILRDLRSLNPFVFLVEECPKERHSAKTWTLLNQGRVNRVVALSLEHNAATVYDRSNCLISTAEDLVHAICGCPHPPKSGGPTACPCGCSQARTAHRAKSAITKGKTGARKGRA